MEAKSERKPKNALREALANPGLPANGSGHGCDVSTTGAQHQQPFIVMTTVNSRLQLALINRKKGRNLIEKGFTLVELMIVIVGILSAVALPNFLNQTAKAKATECTSKAGKILGEVAAESLSSLAAAEALLLQKTAAATVAGSPNNLSELCTFSSNTVIDASTKVPANNIYKIQVTGKGEIAGKYNGDFCLNYVTGEKKQTTNTGGTLAAPDCT